MESLSLDWWHTPRRSRQLGRRKQGRAYLLSVCGTPDGFTVANAAWRYSCVARTPSIPRSLGRGRRAQPNDSWLAFWIRLFSAAVRSVSNCSFFLNLCALLSLTRWLHFRFITTVLRAVILTSLPVTSLVRVLFRFLRLEKLHFGRDSLPLSTLHHPD